MPAQSPSPASAPPNSEELVEQAAEWLVKLSSDDCTAQDHQAFEQWQQQSPAHQHAVAGMQGMIEQLKQLHQNNQAQTHIVEDAIQEQSQLTQKLNSRSSLFIFMMGCMFAALLSWQMLPVEYWLADQSSRYDQWTDQTLLDQSQIKISGHSAYNIQFNAQQRHIELLDGNILVDIAKDATRPFVVKTEFAQIKALGTRFMVQHSDNQTILTMLESKVEVRSIQGNQRQIIEAGQQVVINKQGIQTIHAISPAMLEQAWQKHSLMVDQMPLPQVLDILKSYNQGKIYYHAHEIKQLRVTAILPLNDIDQAFTLLQDSLPIQVSRPVPYVTRVTLKD
ncbi:FecR domain-containing protein [Acinetobacter puyangensis]|uniref:FecR family protein n=1 Tax=Acinetobacter puyangensis TaxID=1096779 RepID=A0A240EED2_9GAMM|nr:FecR domain-containing protein [Acinetobacter puyangensis]SNX46280.1 FecR family protein [Acinetobacter puyangensis]